MVENENQGQEDYRPPAHRKVADEPQQRSWAVVAGAVIGILAIAAAVLVTALVTSNSDDATSTSMSTPASAAPDAPKVVGLASADALAPAACPDGRKHFWAYDAPEGTNAMGPKLSVPLNDEGARIARDRWWTKWVCDPAWSGHAFEGQTVDEPKNFDPVVAQDKAELFNTNPVEWQNAVDQVFQDITGFELRDYGTTRYDSVGMIPDPSGDRSKLPHMTKWGEQPELHLVLVVKTKTHGERLYRLDCDEQFSAPELVKFTPPPPSTPPQTTPPPPPPTKTTPPPPPPTTETTPPPPPTTETTPPPPPPCPPGTVPPECLKPKDTDTSMYPHDPDAHGTVTESASPPHVPETPAGTTLPGTPAGPEVTAPSATTPAPDVNTEAPPIPQAPTPDDPADTDVTPVG